MISISIIDIIDIDIIDRSKAVSFLTGGGNWVMTTMMMIMLNVMMVMMMLKVMMMMLTVMRMMMVLKVMRINQLDIFNDTSIFGSCRQCL